LQDHVVGTLDLAVGLWVSYYTPVHTDVVPVIEVQELFAGELCAIVGDDDVGYPKPVDYVSAEEDSLLGANVCDGSSLDHLENLSMATSKWVYPQAAFWREPTRSRPHTTNGEVMWIICRA